MTEGQCCHLAVHGEYKHHLPALQSCWWCLWVMVAADADLCKPRRSVRLRFSWENMPVYPMHTQSLFPQEQGSSLKESICQHEGSYKTLVIAVCPFVLATDDTLVEQQLAGKTRRRKTSSVISSPTNFIYTTLGLNLGICFEKMAINHLSYDTALQNTKLIPLKLISLFLSVCILVLTKQMAGYTFL